MKFSGAREKAGRFLGGLGIVVGLCASSSLGLGLPLPLAQTSSATPAEGGTDAPQAPAPSPVRARKKVPPAPAPSDAQVAGLAELQAQAKVYEAGARDYRSAISRIVRVHTEEKHRRILAALDAELATEEKSLREARAEAIRRLEVFVGRYRGERADAVATPDAMFRLAALYEERAETEDDGGRGRQEAIGLYRSILQEFPSYREADAVYYYLGHAYLETGRAAEAQQVWRSLVCHQHYPNPLASSPSEPIRTQNRSASYWAEWETRHPIPLDRAEGQAPRPTPPPRAGAPVAEPVEEDELAFEDPYPADCTSVRGAELQGTEPRYVAEVWWRLGNYHFDRGAPDGGPFELNRAESAYRHSQRYRRPPVYPVAMYKLAWTYFEQQRYEASVRKFVELFRYTEEERKRSGDAGADFRSEALSYIASALTYDDFAGPRPSDPDVARADSQDSEEAGPALEAKKRVAIKRLQDPTLIPQGESWTVDVYKALAKEYDDVKQLRNSIEVSELILKRWPFDRDAPQLQVRVAEAYDTLAGLAREGTAEKVFNTERALQARTRLTAYVGTRPWVDANKEDPEAIQAAEVLVRGGLRRAAADHTNAGLAALERGRNPSLEVDVRRKSLERAVTEFRSASLAWQSYLEQDENAPDAYESRFWQAHARHEAIAGLLELGRSPSRADFEEAQEAILDVRDSNEDDKHLEAAAYLFVDLAFLARQDAGAQWKASQGALGHELVDELRLTDAGTADAKAVVLPLSPVTRAVVEALEDYPNRVSMPLDVNKRADSYARQAGEIYFAHGQFQEARRVFEPLYKEFCGRSELGYVAWERLATMANLERDVLGSRALSEAALAHSCAITEEQKLEEARIAKATISQGYYADAALAFTRAEGLPDGPERAQAWRQAAALYKLALEKVPAHASAPEAAINGAFAYKQVGEFDSAIAMYELFIREFGDEKSLAALQKGDAKARPPVQADLKAYQTRLGHLLRARQALASSYALFFNYEAAVQALEAIARYPRFEVPIRRDAAMQAALISDALGDGARLGSLRTTLVSLEPPAADKAKVDFLIASAEAKAWDERGRDDGENRKARLRGLDALEAFYSINKSNSAAAPFVLQAAYRVSKMRSVERDKALSEDWCRRVVDAFASYKAAATADGGREVRGSYEADLAAECRYRQLDVELKREFDFDAGHHRYAGDSAAVITAYLADLKKGEEYVKQLREIPLTYGSKLWTVAATARQGSVYDSCRTGLYSAREPALRIVPEKVDKLLAQAEASGQDELVEQIEQRKQMIVNQWKTARAQKLDEADAGMIHRYAQAVVLAKAYQVRNQEAQDALGRLAFFTDLLGDAKMAGFVEGVEDPSSPTRKYAYEEGTFVRARPGLLPSLASKVEPLVLPLPLEGEAPGLAVQGPSAADETPAEEAPQGASPPETSSEVAP